jgi:hypothetical protein
MSVLISKQGLANLLVVAQDEDFITLEEYDKFCDLVNRMQSAQPEIIRCKDCKYQDENWRRVSVRWLPCMDVRTGSNWYCGSAERRTDE